MFFAINNLGGIIRWASGTLNYLYPVSAMLFVLIPFVMSMNERKIPILYKCISIMFVFLCGNMEQSSAVVMVLGMLIFIYIRFQRKNYDKADILVSDYIMDNQFNSIYIKLYGTRSRTALYL